MTSRSGPAQPVTRGASGGGGMRVVHHTEVVIDLRKAVEVVGPASLDAFRDQIARHENFDETKMPENSDKTKKNKGHGGILVDTGDLLLALAVRSRYSEKAAANEKARAVIKLGWTQKLRGQLRGLWGLGYKLVGGLSPTTMKPLRGLIEREGIFTEKKLR